MQPEHQVLLPDNAHSAPTQSPSVSYPTPNKNKKPAEKKKIPRLEKLRVYINIGLVVIAMTDAIMLAMFIVNVTKIQLKPKVEWVQSHEPQSFSIKDTDFLITSTSETCNELVREYLLVENTGMEPLDIAYVFMIMCLDSAEPHRSSQAGNSVLLMADAKNGACFTINGFGEARALTAFRPFIEVHKEAEYSGETNRVRRKSEYNQRSRYRSKSVHDPAAFLVVEDFVLKYGDKGKKVVLHLQKELTLLRFPMTKQLYSVISHANIENTLLFQSSNSFSYLFRQHYDKSLATEGELMERQKQSWALDRSAEMVADRVKKYGNSAFKNDALPLQEAFAFKKDKNLTKRHMYKRRSMPKIAGTDYSICAMKDPLGMEKKTVATLLAEYNKEETGGKVGEEALKDVNIYKRIFRLLQKHFPDWKKIIKSISSSSDLNKDYAEDVKRLGAMKARRSNRLNYEANSFVIVDRKKEIAIVYSSSLGTAFGSFMSLFSTADTGNNMMYGFGKDYRNVAEYQYLMNPIIITQGKKIHIAYAGQGGWFDISLDIARRLHSLVFTLFHKVPLVESLRTPLIFPLAPTGNGMYTKGFPWVHLNSLRTDFNVSLTEYAPSGKLADIVTAVEGDTAIHFDGRDIAQLIPHGM